MATNPRRQNFQTISWFSGLNRRGLLNLSPPYQRRSVWNQAYKDDFIDTVLLQYPAPALFLYEEVSPEGVSVYQVVDGKQRLTSVFEFANGEFPVVSRAGDVAVGALTRPIFCQSFTRREDLFLDLPVSSRVSADQ